MQWFRNLSTLVKLMAGFALTGAITGIVGWLGVSNMGAINDNADNIYEVQLVPITDLAVMRGLFYQIRGSTYRAVTLNDPAQVKEELD
jgi:methyl-accepting chemotaxis protein